MTDEEALEILKTALTQPGRFRLDDEAVITRILCSYEGMREAAEAYVAARDALADANVNSLSKEDPRFAAVADTLADLRRALQSEAL